MPSIQSYLAQQRNNLIGRGIIISDGEEFKLAQDYTFDSPSTAAGVLLGRSANGHIEWKDEEGRTLKQIQTSAIDEPAP